MPFLARTKILLTLLGVALMSGGVFLWVRDSDEASEAQFRNSQALYAEVPATASSTADALATSTANMPVPILVYHIVRPAYPTDSRAVTALAHTPQVFDAEMKYLGDAGYRVTTFVALEAHLRDGAPLPANPVNISFDDGWSDQFTYAFPILEKYHYPATFFVFTNPIGHHGFLSWNDLRVMLAAGMTIGSHTRSHPFLTKITDPARLWDEIDGSKVTLERNLGIAVNEFAYPFGQYDPAIIRLVEKAGYQAARGDALSRNAAAPTLSQLYMLGALNAPTTTAAFMLRFPQR